MGLPVALVLSLVIGLLTRDRDWLWTALVVPSQVLTMTVRNGALGGLWPLTVFLSTILSFPFVLAASRCTVPLAAPPPKVTSFRPESRALSDHLSRSATFQRGRLLAGQTPCIEA